MDPRAILFDLDGVLVEMRPSHARAFRRALESLALPISEPSLRELEGLSTRQKLARLVQRGALQASMAPQVFLKKQELTVAEIDAVCVPDAEVKKILSSFKELGVPMALCTNSIRKTADRILDRMGIRAYFDVILSNEDVEHAKPDPEIYLRASHLLRIPVERCLVIEDSEVGVKAAIASGAEVFQVASPADLVQRFAEIRGRLRLRVLTEEVA